MHVKSSGMAPGLANARPPRQCKICKCLTPRTDKAGMHRRSRGGGGGEGLGTGGIY